MMVANLQKNIEIISAVAVPRYSVWILCHMVKIVITCAKIGIFKGKIYI